MSKVRRVVEKLTNRECKFPADSRKRETLTCPPDSVAVSKSQKFSGCAVTGREIRTAQPRLRAYTVFTQSALSATIANRAEGGLFPKQKTRKVTIKIGDPIESDKAYHWDSLPKSRRRQCNHTNRDKQQKKFTIHKVSLSLESQHRKRTKQTHKKKTWKFYGNFGSRTTPEITFSVPKLSIRNRPLCVL